MHDSSVIEIKLAKLFLIHYLVRLRREDHYFSFTAISDHQLTFFFLILLSLLSSIISAANEFLTNYVLMFCHVQVAFLSFFAENVGSYC